jgi:hypothetical protein
MPLTHIAFCQVGVASRGGAVPVPDGESVVSSAITPSGSNQQSAASQLPFVRIATDTAIYVAIGTSPDATVTTSRTYMPANCIDYYQIELGNKVAVVTA